MNGREMERFIAKVDTTGDPLECWPWIGCREASGYGNLRVFRDGRWRTDKAHRLIFEHVNGPIPNEVDGVRMVIDHLCRNRACVNPEHLELISQRDNILRGALSGKTHCPQGHAYEPDNFYTDKRTGSAICKTCHKRRSAANRQRRRSGEHTPPTRKAHTR